MAGTITMGHGVLLQGDRAEESIAALIEQRAITPLPEYEHVLQAGFQKEAHIDGQPLIDAEKARQKAIVRDDTTAALERILAKTLETRVPELGRDRLGEALSTARRADVTRQSAFPTPDEVRAKELALRREQALATEWSLLLSSVDGETDLSILETLAADAALTENPTVYRTTMTKVLRQLGTMAERDANDATKGLQRQLAGTFADWRKAHPTPSEIRQQVEDERARLTDELQRSARLYRRLYGLERVR
jgi:hypothetical protein